jgi:hypothetical protein
VTVVVFAGPTLREPEVLGRLPEAIVHGPVALGDVYRAAHSRPLAIAIIDGYFERVPATWHKEILWAMAEGVHVFGASSMGALRAAELCTFGMVGVGRVFEAFRDGELEDDDEVAVVHGPAEHGYAAGSEAMVNIRATLRRAVAERLLSDDTAARLTVLAKDTFYAQRGYRALLAAGKAQGLPQAELEAFRDWLPERRVDQKRLDALQLLDTLSELVAHNPKPKRVAYTFQPTDAWHEAQRLAGDGLHSQHSRAGLDEALLDELKISGAYPRARAAAAARGWALDAARRAAVKPDALAVRTAVETFRRDAGLSERQAFETWREAQRLDDAALTRFFEEQARANWAEPLTDALAHSHLVNYLRSTKEYGALVERAQAKAEQLTKVGLASPSLTDLGVSEEELWNWYFTERLAEQPPADLEVFALSAGFGSTAALRRTALRELAHWRSVRALAPGSTRKS